MKNSIIPGKGGYGELVVSFHGTNIVTVSQNTIILHTGELNTATVIRKMNEVSRQYFLGYNVYRKDRKVMVTYKGRDLNFVNDCHVTLKRRNSFWDIWNENA